MIKHNLSAQVSRLKENGEDPAGLDIEGVRLFAALEKQARPDFECYVLKVNDLSAFLNKLEKDTELKNGESKNIQLIVKSGVHYTTINIQLSEDPAKRRAIILDAVANKAVDKITEILKQNSDTTSGKSYFHNIYTIVSPGNRGIQADETGCPIFALDHAIAISKDPLTTIIADGNPYNQPGSYNIPWENLPPEFVKNAQSVRKFLTNYKKQREGGDEKDLREIGEIDKLTHLVKTGTDENGKDIIQNHEIQRVFERHRDSALAYLNTMTDESVLENIIQPDYTAGFTEEKPLTALAAIQPALITDMNFHAYQEEIGLSKELNIDSKAIADDLKTVLNNATYWNNNNVDFTDITLSDLRAIIESGKDQETMRGELVERAIEAYQDVQPDEIQKICSIIIDLLDEDNLNNEDYQDEVNQSLEDLKTLVDEVANQTPKAEAEAPKAFNKSNGLRELSTILNRLTNLPTLEASEEAVLKKLQSTIETGFFARKSPDIIFDDLSKNGADAIEKNSDLSDNTRNFCEAVQALNSNTATEAFKTIKELYTKISRGSALQQNVESSAPVVSQK